MIKLLRDWMRKVWASGKEPGERADVLVEEIGGSLTPPSELWRQGDILPDELAQSIIQKISEEPTCSSHRDFHQPGILVLVSQDCDLVNPTWDKEPIIEGIWGSSSQDAKANRVEQNSPRAVALRISHQDNEDDFVFEDRNRFPFPRHWLAGHDRFEAKLPSHLRRRLIRMVGRRYDRQPLPSEFNQRLKDANIEKKISELLKKTQDDLQGVAIYVALNTWEELPSTEREAHPYLVYPLAIMRKDVAQDVEAVEKVEHVMHGLEEILKQEGNEGKKKLKGMSKGMRLGLCGLLAEAGEKGISLMDPTPFEDPIASCENILSESLFTLDDLNEFRAWEYDYLSPGDDDSAPISPNTLP